MRGTGYPRSKPFSVNASESEEALHLRTSPVVELLSDWAVEGYQSCIDRRCKRVMVRLSNRHERVEPHGGVTYILFRFTGVYQMYDVGSKTMQMYVRCPDIRKGKRMRITAHASPLQPHHGYFPHHHSSANAKKVYGIMYKLSFNIPYQDIRVALASQQSTFNPCRQRPVFQTWQ
jgi:hypothetical protein